VSHTLDHWTDCTHSELGMPKYRADHVDSTVSTTSRPIQGRPMPKKLTLNALHITSSNVGRFSKFFHSYDL